MHYSPLTPSLLPSPPPGNYNQALQCYKEIHSRFPDNVDCLKFLVRLLSDMGLKEAQEYAVLLQKAEKARETKRLVRAQLCIYLTDVLVSLSSESSRVAVRAVTVEEAVGTAQEELLQRTGPE